MSRNPVPPKTEVDRISFVMGLMGVLAHGAMVALDVALVATSVELVTTHVEDQAALLATALTGFVMLHLLVLAYVGRHVVAYVEVATDAAMPTHARRTRARAAARHASSTLLLTGAMAPAAMVLLLVLPTIGAAVGPFAGL